MRPDFGVKGAPPNTDFIVLMVDISLHPTDTLG
jgi:hypothetical protein